MNIWHLDILYASHLHIPKLFYIHIHTLEILLGMRFGQSELVWWLQVSPPLLALLYAYHNYIQPGQIIDLFIQGNCIAKFVSKNAKKLLILNFC